MKIIKPGILPKKQNQHLLAFATTVDAGLR
jgi:hypothetical protein